MAPALDRLGELNRELPADRRVLPVAALLKACAVVAAEVPRLNGFWADDRVEPDAAVNLGMAVSLRGGGLITPAIADAPGLRLVELRDRVRDLVTRARSGRLRGSELTGATITTTTLGDRGVEAVFGVIHPPQVAVVGFGKVVDRPWAVGGLLGVRPVVTVTLSADHRATDGRTGARFLEVVEKTLSTPEELWPDEARDLIRACLAAVAPGADPDPVPPDADLREELGLDSIDFQTYTAELSRRSGIPVSDDDQRALATIAAGVAFPTRERSRL